MSKDSACINLLQESGESHLLTISFAMNNSFLVKCACAMSVTMIVFIGFQVLLSRLVAILQVVA